MTYLLNYLITFSLFFLVLLVFPVFSWAISSVNVPLDSWVYDTLDRLEGYGLIDSALSGTKPYSRMEAARLTAEAQRKWEERQPQRKSGGFVEKELIPSLLGKLKKEFKVELVESGFEEGSRAPTYLKPIDEVILKYVFQTDDAVYRPQIGNPPQHTIYPIYNNDGIVYQEHHNFSAEFQGEGRLWNHISLYYRPIFKAFEGQKAKLDLDKGYLKVEAARMELEAGRDSLWWGPGYHGALLMTNNARPFDLIKLSNDRPYLLPLLGPFKFNLFFSRLDNEAPSIPKPLLYGLRFNFKPHPIVEFGISHIAIFDGEGREDLSLGDVLEILYSNRNLEGKKASNQQVAIDLVLRWPNFDRILPLARSLKFYGEYGAEDTGFLPDRRAYLLGLFFSDLFLTGRIDLRLEYTNTSPRDVSSAWYTHNEYPPIFHDRIFGHHVGSNGQDYFARLTAYLTPKLLLGFDLDAEIQGSREAVKTNTYRWGTDLEYFLTDRMRLKGRYIVELFKDPDFIAGGDSTRHLFGLEFHHSF